MSESLVLLSMEFVISFCISEQPKIKKDSYTGVEKNHRGKSQNAIE